MLAANGWVVDLHPTPEPAFLEVGTSAIGRVDAGDAPLRHAAAGAALETVVAEGLFAVAAVVDFEFCTYGDTIDELRDYIVETWRDVRMDDETVQRTRAALRAAPAGVRPRVREHVRLTTLQHVDQRPSLASTA